MKKKLIFVLTLLFALNFIIKPNHVNATYYDGKPVTLYVFGADYCSYCNALYDYVENELLEDSYYNDMFEFKYYSIANEDGYYISPYYDYFNKVADYFGYENRSVPFYVVGNKYGLCFNEYDTPDELKELIYDAYYDDSYTDVVAKVINFEQNEKSYKITYKLNGGTNNKDNPATYKKTDATFYLYKPTKKGYTFKGWYLDAKFTKKNWCN